MDVSLLVSVLSLVVSLIALIYTRRKALIDRARYEVEEAKELGKSILLDVLHVSKFAEEMQTSDNPWDPYDLKQVVAHISFTNNSERGAFLKVLKIGIIAVSTLAHHPSRLVRLLGRLIPVRWGLQIALPFRFSDYTASTFITTFPASRCLDDTAISSREHPRLWAFLLKSLIPVRFSTDELKNRISRADKFFQNVLIIDEDADQPLARDDWVEVRPADRKCWAVICDVTPEGAMWVRRSRLDLSTLYISLEFDTRSVGVHAEIPSYYWKVPDESEQRRYGR